MLHKQLPSGFINELEHVYELLSLQISSAYLYILFFAVSGKENKMFLIMRLSFCQPGLAASPTTVGISIFTVTPLPDVVGAGFFFSFQVQLKLLERSKTTWKWDVKSGGGHVCVISFISIRVWWLFSPLGHRLV